jgi:hypothetical protein
MWIRIRNTGPKLLDPVGESGSAIPAYVYGDIELCDTLC